MVPRFAIPATNANGVSTTLGRVRRSTPSIDLRADRRFHVEVGGVLQVDKKATDIFVVTILDVSRSGFRVGCPVFVPVGTGVTLSACNTTNSGEVRYCQEVNIDEFVL